MFGRLAQELAAREKAAQLSMADILELPDDPRRLIVWLMHNPAADLPAVCEFLQTDEADTRRVLDDLVEQGFLRALLIGGVLTYRARIRSTSNRHLSEDIWEALNAKIPPESET
jgi:hypothetical protein